MPDRTPLPISILTVGVAGIVILVAGPTSAQTVKQQQKQLQQQQKSASANAKTADGAATAAQAKAAETKKALARLNDSIKAAQQALDEATKARKAVEDEIVDSQSAASDFGKVRDGFRAADKKYQDARKAVLDSDDYKDRLAKARESEESATAVLALKKEVDEMPEISDARAKLQDAKESYEPLRKKLLGGDDKWVDANKDVKERKTNLDDLNRQFAEASSAASRARADARKATAAAAAADQLSAQLGQAPPTKSNRRNSSQ